MVKPITAKDEEEMLVQLKRQQKEEQERLEKQKLRKESSLSPNSKALIGDVNNYFNTKKGG